MATNAGGLGRDLDIGAITNVIDLDGISTQVVGMPIFMGDCAGVIILAVKAAATTDDYQLDLQEVDAASGGTPRDLDIITDYYTKFGASTTFAGSETWSKVSQSATSEIAAIADSGEKSMLLAVNVRADQLSAGYEYVSVRQPDLGSAGATWGVVLAIKYGLKIQRAPEKMPAFTR